MGGLFASHDLTSVQSVNSIRLGYLELQRCEVLTFQGTSWHKLKNTLIIRVEMG